MAISCLSTCYDSVAGKTLLAKAVANETSATFLRVVGSELIQKYLGDGPKLVREMFKLAKEHAPSIVFIDEIDAVGTKRSALVPAGASCDLSKWKFTFVELYACASLAE